MKWVFLAVLFLVTPAAAAFLRVNQRFIPHACFILAVAIFFQNPYFSVSPYFWSWPGPFKGFQFSVVDAIALAMIFSVPKVRAPVELKVALGIILFAVAISSFAA